jgi:hypothetical protein
MKINGIHWCQHLQHKTTALIAAYLFWNYIQMRTIIIWYLPLLLLYLLLRRSVQFIFGCPQFNSHQVCASATVAHLIHLSIPLVPTSRMVGVWGESSDDGYSDEQVEHCIASSSSWTLTRMCFMTSVCPGPNVPAAMFRLVVEKDQICMILYVVPDCHCLSCLLFNQFMHN